MLAGFVQAGKLLRTEGFKFDLAYTSVLKRAIKTLQNVLEQLDQLWVPVEKSWRLNERHYGDLQGRNKAETAKKFGDKQVHIWRRSYDVPPAGEGICSLHSPNHLLQVQGWEPPKVGNPGAALASPQSCDRIFG